MNININSPANKVFGCDELRSNIIFLSLTKRCKRCNKKMRQETFPNPDATAKRAFCPPFFWFYKWNESQNHIKKEFCNLCFYAKDPDSPALREYYKF